MLAKPMDIAIEFNNKGVSFLHGGNHKQSLFMFTAACEVMTFYSKHIDNLLQQQGSVNEKTEDNQTLDMITNTASIQRALDLLVVKVSSRGITADDDEEVTTDNKGLYFVYKKALRINKSSLIHGKDNVAKCRVYSSIILFNLALMYHLKYISHPVVNRAMIHKALALYNMANDLIMNGIDESIYLQDLIIVLNNNLAVVHYDLGSYRQSRHVLDFLLAYISESRTARNAVTSEERQVFQTNQVTTISGTSCIEGIVSNSFLLREPSVAGAA